MIIYIARSKCGATFKSAEYIKFSIYSKETQTNILKLTLQIPYMF